jgi:hypothetical protein
MAATGLMAFGTRQYAAWVPAPQAPMVETFHGFLSSRDFPNGQVAITRSAFRSKKFAWVFKGSDSTLATLIDYVRGNYGPGPWLFHDPAALLYGNLCPAGWSKPGQFVGQRGINALDFFSLPVSFSGSRMNNPNANAVSLTGATGLPAIGAAMYCINSTAPAWPLNNLTRPFLQMLIPPNYSARITAWGVQNTPNNDPGYYYVTSDVGPTNAGPGAGTKIDPTASGTVVTISSTSSWRVLDMWIGAGSSTANTDWTTFGALDVRMGITPPSPVTAFETGRGQMPVVWSTADSPLEQTYVGSIPANSLYQLTAEASEVAMPW